MVTLYRGESIPCQQCPRQAQPRSDCAGWGKSLMERFIRCRTGPWPAGNQYGQGRPLHVHASSRASMLHAKVELIRVPLLCLPLQGFQGFLFPMEIICPGFVVLLSFQQAKLPPFDPACFGMLTPALCHTAAM